VVAGLVSALAEEARAGNPAGLACAESLAAAVVARLFRRDAEEAPESRAHSGLTTPGLRRVLERIAARLGEDLSLGELASESGLSLYHFVRSFKESVGLSPHQYILRKRIDRAQRLLRESDLPLAAIAAQCGFRTQSSFTTAFRRVQRMTPRAFRRAI
jgi:AraC family transcriptional regulator